jgi:hypothetical protein
MKLLLRSFPCIIDRLNFNKISQASDRVQVKFDILNKKNIPSLVNHNTRFQYTIQDGLQSLTILCFVQQYIALFGPALVDPGIRDQCIFDIPLPQFQSTCRGIKIRVYLVILTLVARIGVL